MRKESRYNIKDIFLNNKVILQGDLVELYKSDKYKLLLQIIKNKI